MSSPLSGLMAIIQYDINMLKLLNTSPDVQDETSCPPTERIRQAAMHYSCNKKIMVGDKIFEWFLYDACQQKVYILLHSQGHLHKKL